MAYCYIVECRDGSFYVGSTENLEHRIWQHNETDEGPNYTRRRRPVRLVWSQEVPSIADAFAFERRVHGWSRAKRFSPD